MRGIANITAGALFGVVLTLVVNLAEPVFAQTSTTASVTGRVLDPTAAVISDAAVTLTHVATNRILATNTDASGTYRFPRVEPGTHVLAVGKDGFKRTVIDQISISVNDATVLDVTLTVGELTESVDIDARPSLVQTSRSDLSTLVDQQRVQDLPLNGKDFLKLVLLTPGVGGTNASIESYSISGSRRSYNTFTIDGISNNDEGGSRGSATGGGAASFDGSAPNVISTEAVAEFRIVSANADATFGRSSGGQINIITKSGTNELRGSAYEFLRNDALDARNFFNTGPFFDERGRAKVPPFKQHLFGASLGGRVVRDRHFFFTNYEGFRQRLQQTQSLTAPNRDLLTMVPGDLGRFLRTFYVDRGVVSSTGPAELRPLPSADRSAAVAAGFPAALFDGDLANGEAGSLLISTAPTRDLDQDALFVRTDHVLGNNLRAAVRYSVASPTQVTATSVPLDLTQDARRWQSGGAEVVMVLSPTQLLELRAGVLSIDFQQSPVGGVPSLFTNLGVQSNLGIQVTSAGTGLSATSVLGTNGFAEFHTVPQGSVLHTWSRGSWTVRSGLDLTWIRYDLHNGAGRPNYTFNGYVGPTGLLGIGPSQPQAVASPATGTVFGAEAGPDTAFRRWRSSRQELFSQADWRVTPRLTLNLGVRYTVFEPWSEADGNIANLYATDSAGRVVPDASTFQFGPTANTVAPLTADTPFYQPDHNNLQPRLGAAWDIAGNARTVVRGAYGLYYDRVFPLMFNNFGGVVNNPPFATASTAANVPFLLDNSLPIVPGVPVIASVEPTIRNARTHRVNVAVEREVSSNASVAAAYVGAFGRGLYGAIQLNGGGATPQALRPDPRYSTQTLNTNLATSDYHSLQLTARQRFTRGVTLMAAYTFADAKDDLSAETFAAQPGLVNLGASTAQGFQGGLPGHWVERPRAADWGYADFAVRHNLTISHVLELPFGNGRRFFSGARGMVGALVNGWSVAGFGVWRSGEPFDLRLGTDANDDGDANDRPPLISGTLADLYARGGDRAQYLLPQTDARSRLGAPANPSDPFAVVPRNALTGPAVWYYDLSLVKRIPLGGSATLAAEINAFNVFNRANLGPPIATLSDARFGRVIATARSTNPRQIQLGARVTF